MREETNLESPPTIRPSGWILICRRSYLYSDSQKKRSFGKGLLFLELMTIRMLLSLLRMLPKLKGDRFFCTQRSCSKPPVFNGLPLEGNVLFQGPCCSLVLRMVNVFALTLLNILPLLTFLVMAETMLSRSKTTLKFSFALVIISDI